MASELFQTMLLWLLVIAGIGYGAYHFAPDLKEFLDGPTFKAAGPSLEARY